MKKLTLKYRRSNNIYVGHTAVFLDGQEVGYFLPNRSKFRTANWHYCPSKGCPFNKWHLLQAYNRKALIRQIEEKFNAKF